VADSGALVSAIGQSVELLGVLLLGVAAWLGVRRYGRLVGEVARISVEYAQRQKEDNSTAGQWRDAEYLRLGIPRPHTWGDIGWIRLEMSLFIARDQASQWFGGALLIVVGLALSIVGGFMQAAG
jgi:hypothetical protein